MGVNETVFADQPKNGRKTITKTQQVRRKSFGCGNATPNNLRLMHDLIRFSVTLPDSLMLIL